MRKAIFKFQRTRRLRSKLSMETEVDIGNEEEEEHAALGLDYFHLLGYE